MTTRQVLGLQMVSRDWNALAMHYLAQARVHHRRVTSVTCHKLHIHSCRVVPCALCRVWCALSVA